MEQNRRKKIAFVVIVLFLICMIPLIYLGKYDYSSADDYYFGLQSHLVWANSHSLLKTIWQGMVEVKKIYTSWQGTYSAMLFMVLQPGIFGETVYHFGPMIVLGILIFATFYFIYIILHYYAKADKYDVIIISIAVLLIQIEIMPNAIQGIYWWNSAFYYTGGYAVMVITFALAIKLISTEMSLIRRIVDIILCSIFCLLIGGNNYIVVLLTVEFYALLLLINIFVKNGKVKNIIIPFGVLIIGFGISALAPGNQVRSAQLGVDNTFFLTIINSFIAANKYIKDFFSIWLLIIMIIIAPILYKVIDENKIVYRFFVVVYAGAYCFFASSFAPTYFAMGYEGPYRTWNVRYYLLIVLLVFCEAFTIGYIKQIFKIKEKKNDNLKLNIFYSVFLGIFVMSMLFVGRHDFISYEAVTTLFSGEAKKYGEEMQNRIDTLNSSTEEIIYFDELTVKPELLYYADVEVSANGFNGYIAKWYGKEYVCFPENEYAVQ